MAKKKVTTTVEETEEAPEKEINYTEDIKGKSMSEVVKEPDEKEEPEVVVEEEKPEQETKPKEDKPELDTEKLKKDIADETTNKIVEALTGKDKTETEEKVDEYEKWASQYTEETGKQPTWVEAAKFIKDQAKAEILADQQEQVRTNQEQQIEAKKVEDEKIKKFNGEVDEELAELYASNKLAKIKDAEDPNDRGVVERKALFQTMIEVNAKRVEAGQEPIRSISRIYNNYHKAPTRQPAGADAAIINNRASTGSASDDENYSYKDIHGKGWRSFFKR